MAMGFKDLPEYKDYWATDPILHDPFISSVLSRQRYEKLCQYLLCSILTNKEAGDKLAKIRPLITLCETNFRQCFVPLQNLSIDEAMIQFDGRLAWKQYMPNKLIKLGIKLWCLCDSNTGYCVAFSVYCGTDQEQGVNLDSQRLYWTLPKPTLHIRHRLRLCTSHMTNSSGQGHGAC